MKQSIDDYHGESGVYELDASSLGADFRADIERCVAAQRAAAAQVLADFRPSPLAAEEVSETALARVLTEGRDVHGISKDRNISNVIVFNSKNIGDVVHDVAVADLRRKVDRHARILARQVFRNERWLIVRGSGHFWYPPGSHMAWHTNSGAPGWRVYINYAEEEGKSFFRYRDPKNFTIVTLMDKRWNIRIFKISRESPLWHAVYSGTNRFSLGYVIYQASWREYFREQLRRVL
jgi:hypothetical protein